MYWEPASLGDQISAEAERCHSHFHYIFLISYSIDLNSGFKVPNNVRDDKFCLRELSRPRQKARSAASTKASNDLGQANDKIL